MIVGHEDVVGAWKAEMPDTLLLVGPDSIGKYTLAQHMLSEEYGCAFSESRVPIKARRGVITNEAGFKAAQYLQTLSPGMVVVAVAEERSWLESAVQCVYRMSPLSYENVCDVLNQKRLVPAPVIGGCAMHARGQVKNAIAYYRTTDDRQLVPNILRATRTGDVNLLSTSVRGLRTFEAVTLWWTEAVTGNWNFFTPEDSWECHTSKALLDQVARAASMASAGVSPAIAAHLAFGDMCRKMGR